MGTSMSVAFCSTWLISSASRTAVVSAVITGQPSFNGSCSRASPGRHPRPFP
jgi:hypothetical protein